MNIPTPLTSLIGLALMGCTVLYLANITAADETLANNTTRSTHQNQNESTHAKQEPVETQSVRVTPPTLAQAQFVNITMPRSLADTDPSSLVHVDANNNLVLDSDIKMLFDYFFTSDGDLSQAELLTSIKQYIQQSYPAPASQQALELFDKYLDYKQQMQDFYADNNTLQNLPELSSIADSETLQTVEELMHNRQDMREQVFTPEETDALFGEQLRYDQFMLNVARIDTHLSSADRSQQMEQLAYQHFTADEQAARQQTFILRTSPADFHINSAGDCEGNTDNFSQQQINSLCQLATDKQQRSIKQKALLGFKNDLIADANLNNAERYERLNQQAQILGMSEREYKLFLARQVN